MLHACRWRELPQVSFMSRQKLTKVDKSTTKVDKSTTKVLSRQNTCLSRQNTSFVATKSILDAPNFCRDFFFFFVATKRLSRQACFCRQTRVCRDKSKLVATKLCLLRQRTCLPRQKLNLCQLPPNDTRALVTVGTPDYILELLKEGNYASHNDGGNHTGSANTMPSEETYNVDNLAGNSG